VAPAPDRICYPFLLAPFLLDLLLRGEAVRVLAAPFFA